MAEILLRNKRVKVNIPNTSGETPLELAESKDSNEVAEAILKKRSRN
ncbi:MAG: hypothetical protein PV340_02375 [Wolbachia sp.]|nr:hypothetical protein [Wolbachia sp.]